MKSLLKHNVGSVDSVLSHLRVLVWRGSAGQLRFRSWIHYGALLNWMLLWQIIERLHPFLPWLMRTY